MSIALLGLVLAGCGGGSSDGTGSAMAGSRQYASVKSHVNGITYPLDIYLPPASAGARSGLPVVYALDGDTWFEVLVGIAEAARTPVIIVGIGNSVLRNTDFVPPNNCTPNGGGQQAYFDFIRQDLTPYVESTIGGDPAQRALLGHSHGGSFVLYAMFAEGPGQQHFSAYLASDSSVSCMTETAAGWERAYAAAHTDLPTRLNLSYATAGNYAANLQYVQTLAARRYAHLVMKDQPFTGTHGGIVPAAFADAIAFALASGS